MRDLGRPDYRQAAAPSANSLLSVKRVSLGLIIVGVLSLSSGFIMTTNASRTVEDEQGKPALPPAIDFEEPSRGAMEQPTEVLDLPTVTPQPATPASIPLAQASEPEPTTAPQPLRQLPQPEPAPPLSAPSPASPPPSAPAKIAPPASVALHPLERELIELQNEQRRAAGLEALRVDAALVNVARQRAQDLASKGYFEHTSPAGETAFSMMLAQGIDYSFAGENLARNNYPDSQSPTIAITDLMKSPIHRMNVLEPGFASVGVGLVYGSDGFKYFAILFSD